MGFSLWEIDELDIGMMKDIVIEKYNRDVKRYNNLNRKSGTKKATQADFDRF